MIKEANNSKLTNCLLDIQIKRSEGDTTSTTTLLRQWGFSTLFADIVNQYTTADSDITIDTAIEVREKCKALRKERKAVKQAKKREEAEKPLPLSNSSSEDPLDAYEPRELIANLRKRGYQGELFYTKVYKVTL